MEYIYFSLQGATFTTFTYARQAKEDILFNEIKVTILQYINLKVVSCENFTSQ